MDDSFKLRADKIFGSLSASLSSSRQPPQSSPWSVAAAEVERRQWRRPSDAPDRDETPCASSFQGEFGIGSSIGMDPTLDFEDEEDEYDKVASGAEAGDDNNRLFMDDVTHHGSYLNSYNVLIGKDSRANHLAARHRLKEDDAEAQGPILISADYTAPVKEQREDGYQPKPILKRKDNSSDSKSQKRVRFDPAFVDKSDGEESSGNVENLASDNGSGISASRVSLKKETASQVPDYLVNPSKYLCYSFDSTSEVDEGGDKACMDYVTQVESSRSDTEMEDASPQLPRSVTFVPKKKTVDASARTKQEEEDDNKHSLLQKKGFAVGVAAMEENEISAVEEEDKSEENAAVLSEGLSKSSRKFRTKPMSDDESDS